MLVSHRHQFIYLKTIKTAGTSVEIYFERFCVPSGEDAPAQHGREAAVSAAGIVGFRGADTSGQEWYNHMPARLLRERLGSEAWDAYFKFCAIRNPFDKAVSWFWFSLPESDRRELSAATFATVRAAFSRWIAPDVLPRDRDVYTIDGREAVDAFVRYEHLEDDLSKICAGIGVPWVPRALGRYKSEFRTRAEPFAEYYEAAEERIVRDVYGWELGRFGYTLGTA